MATSKDTDAVAGPATPAGAPIQMTREQSQAIAAGEKAMRAYMAEQPQVELPVLLRSIFGDTAHASINGLSIKVQTGVPGQKVAKPFHDLLVHRQNESLRQEAEAQSRAGR